MKRLTIFSFILVLLLWGRSPVVSAQFFQAGVQQFKTPVAAPDFKLDRLGGGEVSLKEGLLQIEWVKIRHKVSNLPLLSKLIFNSWKNKVVE